MAYSEPWPLTHKAIDAKVTEESPGTYFVGRIEKVPDERGEVKETFIYVKIGRDDVSVNVRLHDYVNDPEFARWRFFKFRYWPTPIAAFEEECRVYHRKPGPKNEIHPARPDGMNIHCRVSEECFPDADDEDDA